MENPDKEILLSFSILTIYTSLFWIYSFRLAIRKLCSYLLIFWEKCQVFLFERIHFIRFFKDFETAASRDSGHKTISREDDESDEPNSGKPDLLSLFRDIVSPFLSWMEIKWGDVDNIVVLFHSIISQQCRS